MLSVRPYTIADRAQVENICLENAGCANSMEETKEYTLLTRCAYYIEQERGNCFVAVDDEGKVVGYILCAENYNNYEKDFIEKYIPRAAAISAKRYVDAKFDMLRHGMYRKVYPAHMFINVEIQSQNLGVGALLLSTLKAHLKKKYVKGLMLVCDADNEDLIRFFEKNGFRGLMTTRYGRAMAVEFDK